jgi:hypothetical protein
LVAGLTGTTNAAYAIPGVHVKNSWSNGKGGVFFSLFCSATTAVERQSKSLRGSGEGTTEGETEKGLLMGLSILITKKKNWRGYQRKWTSGESSPLWAPELQLVLNYRSICDQVGVLLSLA